MDDYPSDDPPSIEDRVSQHMRDVAVKLAAKAAGDVQPPHLWHWDIVLSARTEADMTKSSRGNLEIAFGSSLSNGDIEAIVRDIAAYAETLGVRPLAAMIQSPPQSEDGSE